MKKPSALIKFVFKAFTISLLLLLTSCAKQQQADLSQYQDQRDFCPKITQQSFDKCAEQKGDLLKQGKAQCYTCTISYQDGGTTCRGSDDCQGNCYNRGEPVPVNVPNQVGQCAHNNITFGCHQKIENGIAAEGMLCID